MKLLRTIVVVSTLFANWFASSPALSASHTGKVLRLLLNSEMPGRGLCIKMLPDIPGVAENWGCLHKDNALYNEISALLFTAYTTGVDCVITWRVPDNRGHAKIVLLECFTEVQQAVAPGQLEPAPWRAERVPQPQ
jgi:hypothetical protein